MNEYFPSGLHQPSQGYRFSIDALLLSCFAPTDNVREVVDLGTGCGVVGIGYLLRSGLERIKVTGIDIEPDMIACAAKNVGKFQLEGFYTPVLLDVAAIRDHFPAEQWDLVLCNPPFREPGRGRVPPDSRKRAARFEQVASLDSYLQATTYLLKNKARTCFVFLAERLPMLLAGLQKHKLEPKRVRFVHGRIDLESKMVLVEARKNGNPGLRVQEPLILYRDRKNTLTPEAVRACPFLCGQSEGRVSTEPSRPCIKRS